jgi:putative transposase
VVSKAVVIAYGVHETGRREILGLDVGEAETEAFGREFLGVADRPRPERRALVVSDAHEGLKAAIARLLRCPGSAAACTSSAIASAVPARTSTGSWPR